MLFPFHALARSKLVLDLIVSIQTLFKEVGIFIALVQYKYKCCPFMQFQVVIGTTVEIMFFFF